MEEKFEQLVNRHRKLKRERNQLKDEVVLQQVEVLLNDIREAGKFIIDPEERDILSNLAVRRQLQYDNDDN